MVYIKLLINSIIKTENGFSLIELLAALVVLTIFIFAFTPLLLASIANIHHAGDKSEALHEGQSELEVDIAELRTVDGHELEFIFGDQEEGNYTSIIVAGGLVEVDKSKGEASAWLSGFVPNVPTISIDPSLEREGYDDELEIEIKGRETDFEEAETVIIKDEIDGTEKQDPTTIENISEYAGDNYDEKAEFKLDEGLTNTESPYIVTTSWEVEDGIEVTARARLYVKMPRAVAVGDGRSILLSSDEVETWNEMDRDRIPVESGYGDFNDVIWTSSGRKYAIVSATGHILIWKQGEKLKDIELPSGVEDLLSITYGDREFVAVGKDGQIVRLSADNYNDNESYSIGNDAGNLKAVKWNEEEEKYMAVGENGAIFYSSDSSPESEEDWVKYDWDDKNWIEYDWGKSEESAKPDFTLHGVTYGNSSWYVVGDDDGKAVIFKYSNSNGVWDKVVHEIDSASGLNDIIYDESRFVAVGEGGTVLTSSNGNEWEKVEEDFGNNNLLALDWRIFDGKENYIIVGDNSTVYTGLYDENEVNWDSHDVDNSSKGVAFNWTR